MSIINIFSNKRRVFSVVTFGLFFIIGFLSVSFTIFASGNSIGGHVDSPQVGEQQKAVKNSKGALRVSELETVGETSNPELGIEGSSFAGEVVSKMDVNIYSQREGVITNLTVNIGDSVSKGQAIAQLSVPTEFDQIATTAEKKGDLENARTKLDAVNNQLNDVRNRLNSRKSAADAKKNARITDANNEFSTGAITSQTRDKEIKEAESDYADATAESDNEVSGLIREQKESEKEAQSAENVNKIISSGIDRNVYAVRAGIISGIFKNVGDTVGPDERIAAVGIKEPTAKDRCVRFKIPGNFRIPQVGDIVTVTRPGLPFTKQTATITGVGTALDDNGNFVAEAFFEEIVDWPVHASVRVQAPEQLSQQIMAPLSAVWFDNSGVPSIWVVDAAGVITAYNVTPGRAIGERIEILDGLQSGDRIVVQPTADMKNGDVIKEPGQGPAVKSAEPAPGGDGHDHEH